MWIKQLKKKLQKISYSSLDSATIAMVFDDNKSTEDEFQLFNEA